MGRRWVVVGIRWVGGGSSGGGLHLSSLNVFTVSVLRSGGSGGGQA